MPTWDHLQIVKPNGEIELHPLDPALGVVNIGRDAGNEIVIDGPHIQPFHAFLDYRQKPVRLNFIAPEQAPRPLLNFGTVELGGHVLVFLEGAAQATGPAETGAEEAPLAAGAPTPSALLTIPFPNQSDPLLQLQLSGRTWSMAIEQTVLFYATVTHGGDLPADFSLTVVGLAESWVTCSASQFRLEPGAEQIVAVTLLKVPRQPASRAGVHHFALKLTSPHYPQRYSQQRATLTVPAYYDFALKGLSPKARTIAWSTASAGFEFSILNTSNTIARFELSGQDEQSSCNFEFQLPGEAIHLADRVAFSLLPEEKISIPLRVAPRSRPFAGWRQQRYHFALSVQMPQNRQLPRLVLGQISAKPLLGPGMLTLLILALLAFGALIAPPLLEYRAGPASLVATQGVDSVDKSPFTYPIRPEAPLPGPGPADAGAIVTYEEMFREIARQHRLDWRLLEAVAYQESRMNYLALGAANDMGLMQIIPSTWNEWAPKVAVFDPFDPYSNVTVGAAYLAFVRDFCLARGRAEPQWMLVAYNWGPQRLDQLFKAGGTWDDIPAMQRQYATNILRLATNRALHPAAFDQFYSDLYATR